MPHYHLSVLQLRLIRSATTIKRARQPYDKALAKFSNILFEHFTPFGQTHFPFEEVHEVQHHFFSKSESTGGENSDLELQN